MKWSLISGRIWLVLGTVLVVGLLFAYYFLSYVPHHEKLLLGKKYRALERIARNFSEMRSDYEGSIDLLLRKQQDDNSVEHDSTTYYINQIRYFMFRAPEASRNFQRKMRRYLDEKRKRFEEQTALLKQEFAKIKVETVDSVNNDARIRQNHYLYIGENYRVKVTDLITNGDIIDNQFDRFLVIRVFKLKRMQPDSGLSADSAVSVIAYQGKKLEQTNGAESKILLADINTLFDSAHVFRTIPQHIVKISGKPYRALSYVLEMEPDEDWILCGLVNESKAQADIRKIDLFVLIIIVLLALFLLLSMPVLKLLIMSSIERLQIINVWFIGFSIVTGTALVTILLLVSHHYVNYQEDYKVKLYNLSTSVAKNFKAEIDTILQQMTSIDTTLLKNKSLFSLKMQYPFVLDAPDSVLNKSSLGYKYFNELIFLNASGKAPVTFANHDLPSVSQDLPDLSKRKYFSEAKQNNLMRFEKSSMGFYIQSIRSWNTGSHEAGVSIRRSLTLDSLAIHSKTSNADSLSIVVVATATKLRSVMNPLLPAGFKFCVIDARGDVLFHSDVNKNLQENFFDEIGHDYLARATVLGRTSRHLDVNYSGTKSLAHISPLDTQELFLVTMLDREYYNTPVVLTVGFVWVLTSAMMLLLAIQLIVLFCVTYRSSRLRIRRFSLGWLSPRSGTVADPYNIRYARCIAGMMMIAPVLLGVCIWGAARYLSVIFLTLPVLLFAGNYAVLFVGDPENNSRRHRNIFVAISLFLVFLITVSLLGQIPIKSGLWLVTLQAILVSGVWLNTHTDTFRDFHNWVTKNVSIGALYKYFLCCWLFMVSVLPIFYFYKTSFLHENFLWRKFIQWEAYEHIGLRTASLEGQFEELGFTNVADDTIRSTMKTAYLTAADWYGNYLGCDMDSADVTNAHSVEDGFIEKMEFEFRPSFLGPLENSRHVLLNGENTLTWLAHSTRESLILMNDKRVVYSSVIPPFSLKKGKYAVAFVVLFLIFGSLIYALIRTCVKYIFGWGLLVGDNSRYVTSHPVDIAESISKGSHKLFIIGLPYSGRSTIVKKFKEGREVKEIFMRGGGAGKGDLSYYNSFVVHNFEHGLNDQEMNERRLQLFVDMQKIPNAIIVVMSTVQPETILDILEAKIKQLVQERKNGGEKESSVIQKELMGLRNAYRTWKNILTGFETQYHTLSRTESGTFLEQELQIGAFLPKLKAYFQDTEDSEEREEIVLSIEERANAYYQGLWNSFSRIEKHALFDLAKDRFVNLRDTSKIRVLIRKGVIVMRDSPQIMNKSFNDFILSVVKEDEAVAMTNELRQKGSWSGIQLILIIALVSITIFIALVQQEMLSSVNALVATVSGVIALLIRFSGLFGSSKAKE